MAPTDLAFQANATALKIDDVAVAAIRDHGGVILTDDALRLAPAPVAVSRRRISSGWVAGPAKGLAAVAFSFAHQELDKIAVGGRDALTTLEIFANMGGPQGLRLCSCRPDHAFAADLARFSFGLTWKLATGTMTTPFAVSTKDQRIVLGWDYDFDVVFAASRDRALLSVLFGNLRALNVAFEIEFLNTAPCRPIAEEAFAAAYADVFRADE